MHPPINDLTAEQASSKWMLEEETGFILKVATGARADIRQHDGYRVVRGFGRHYKSHRIAWLLHYGSWPSALLDHINGDRSDNRIENLRDLSHAENQRNLTIHRRDTSNCDRDRKTEPRDKNSTVTSSRARKVFVTMSRC